MIHNIWNYPIGIYDDVFDPAEVATIAEQLDQHHANAGTYHTSFEAHRVPEWITPLTTQLTTYFKIFLQEIDEADEYSPIFYQTLRNEHYSRNNALAGSWEPHNDIYERALWSVAYYLRVDSHSVLPDGYVGGELSINDRFDYASFPKNVQLIECKQNRLVIFSPVKTHRIRPYFGVVPRLSISQFWSGDVTAMNPDTTNIL